MCVKRFQRRVSVCVIYWTRVGPQCLLTLAAAERLQSLPGQRAAFLCASLRSVPAGVISREWKAYKKNHVTFTAHAPHPRCVCRGVISYNTVEFIYPQ